MNRTNLIATLRLAPFALLASAGCQSVLNAGFQADGGSQTSTTADGTSGSSSGAAGTSAGLGSNSGAGTSTGGGQGSSSGARMSAGSSGTSTGEYSGDAGPCQANGSACDVNAQCCTRACNDGCTQAFGDGCIMDGDCASSNCVNGHCACSAPQGNAFGTCATDADCCSATSCTRFPYNGHTAGACCNDVGQACNGPGDCCDGDCVNGQCQCLSVGQACGDMFRDTACCSGLCGGGVSNGCVSGPGEQCSGPSDCSTLNCVDGGCGCGLFLGLCGPSAPCCSGFACGTYLAVTGTLQDPGPPVAESVLCCAATGAACSGIDSTTECCGKCDGTNCACEPPGAQCLDDQGCCPGGACMTQGDTLACCQLTGQECFSPGECCTGYCASNDTCACMPDGGLCGPIGYYTALGPAGCCSGACNDAGACL